MLESLVTSEVLGCSPNLGVLVEFGMRIKKVVDAVKL
jgi:hypothetical protein